MCTDAAKLAKLKAGIKALHGKFKNSLKKQPLSPAASARTQTPNREKQDTNTTALPLTKTVQRGSRDHEYWSKHWPDSSRLKKQKMTEADMI